MKGSVKHLFGPIIVTMATIVCYNMCAWMTARVDATFVISEYMDVHYVATKMIVQVNNSIEVDKRTRLECVKSCVTSGCQSVLYDVTNTSCTHVYGLVAFNSTNGVVFKARENITMAMAEIVMFIPRSQLSWVTYGTTTEAPTTTTTVPTTTKKKWGGGGEEDDED